jgi:hypothetical protein
MIGDDQIESFSPAGLFADCSQRDSRVQDHCGKVGARQTLILALNDYIVNFIK